MTTKLNLNQSPYFDDYDQTKKYYQILFRPGRAVQARELTQLQTILQKQIERLGTNIFKQGDNVIPGNDGAVRFLRDTPFIKIPKSAITTINQNDSIDNIIKNNFLNKIIVCSSSGNVRQGLSAKVIGYRLDEVPGAEVRLFLSILTASSSGNTGFFKPGDQITIEGTSISATIPSIVDLEGVVGTVCSVIVQEGVYFYNGYFVYVEPQRIFLTPNVDSGSADDEQNQNLWNNTPTATVGLKITETIKTYQLNSDLLDNATGTPNQSAPGADRLFIDAELIQISRVNQGQELPNDFIHLLDVDSGAVNFIKNKTEYNVLLDTLARRTYDESGDYVVNDFVIHVKNFLRDEDAGEEQDGVYDIKNFQYTTQAEAKAASLLYFKHLLPTNSEGVGIKYPNTDNGDWYPGTSYNDPTDKTSFKNLCDGLLSIRIDPGKAYVKGYEIQKLSRETLNVPKARSVQFINNNVSTTSIGSYFNVTDLTAQANCLKQLLTVGLYNKRMDVLEEDLSASQSSKIGEAKIVTIENTQISGVHRAYLTDIKMFNGAEIYEIKSVYLASPEIKANIELTEVALTGSISVSVATEQITGSGTKWKTNVSEQLKINDVVRIGGTNSYLRVTENPINDTILSVDGPIAADVSGRILYYTYAQLNNEESPGLLYNLAHEYVNTIRTKNSDNSISDNTDIIYTIPTVFTSVDSPGYVVQINGGFDPDTSDRFDTISNVYKIVDATGKWYSPVASSESPTNSNNTNISFTSGGLLQLKFTSTDSAGDPVAAPTGPITIVAPVIRGSKKEKTKTLTNGTVVSGENETSEVSLEQYDVFRIKTVINFSGGDEPTEEQKLNGTNIAALYTLDTGQRDFYYDKAKIILRPDYQKPSGKIYIEFEYFVHEGEGDYFSVDSYVNIPYGEISNYTSSSGAAYALTDCLDFRKKLNQNSGKSPIQRIICDYFFYTGRNDKIILSSTTKKFELSQGVPDLIPQSAQDFSDGLTICELLHKPFGITRESCAVKYLDNKRYTMRDIGKLEKRIKNLEYYTSLTLLEKETSELLILDANGNNRFKNGFLVDNFSSLDSSDITSSDFTCTIDTDNEKVARPFINDDFIELIEIFDEKTGLLSNPETIKDARKNSHYAVSKNVYTLPYDKKIFLTQSIASKLININPYDVQSYIGELRLTPWTDSWRETKILEPIIIQDQNAYNEAMQKIDGQIEYSKPFEVFSGTTISRPRKVRGKNGEKIVKGGHEFFELLKKTDRKAYEKAKETKVFKVPEPYENAGEIVPISMGNTEYRRKFTTTRTTTTTTIRTGLETSVVDLGISETRALTKSELSEIQFIRSREIQFSGTSFKPYSNLYAFFDNISVSEDCRPILSGAAGWKEYEKVLDVYSLLEISGITSEQKATLGIDSFVPATADSRTKIFKIKPGASSGTQFQNSGNNLVGDVRPGCEVIYRTISGIIKKFEVVSISVDKTHIVCVQKDDLGLIKENSTNLEPNHKNSFDDLSAGYTIEISKHTFGDQLQADGAGSIKGAFKIPNRTAKRFKTGDVTFTLSSSNLSGSSADTTASTRYTARGLLDTQQYTITQTRQFTVTTNAADPDINDRVGEPEVGQEYSDIIRRDPIAQTFFIEEKGGCFITDIDVFFAKKPKNGQVLLELRPADRNGPIDAILGGDLGKVSTKENKNIVINRVTYDDVDQTTNAQNKTLNIEVDADADINEIGASITTDEKIIWNENSEIKSQSLISKKSTTVIANMSYTNPVVDMSDLMIPTRFTFDSPIFLEENKTYCVVLLSDSNEYEVWIAQRGKVNEKDANIAEYKYYSSPDQTNVRIGTTTSIDGERLYPGGDFYKSKNGFAWSIDPTISLKFNLIKAQFDITNGASIKLVNSNLLEQKIFTGGVKTKKGSNRLRITVPNHGFATGDKIKLIINSNDDGLLGISRELFKDELLITRTEIDQIIVELPITDSGELNAIQTGTLGGIISIKGINKRFEQGILSANTFLPTNETSVEYSLQTTSTKGVHQFNSDGSEITILNEKTDRQIILPSIPIEFDSSMKINCEASEPNIIINSTDSIQTRANSLLSRKSLIAEVVLRSTNPNLSPVFDPERFGLGLISTRLDDPQGLAASSSAKDQKTLINDVFDNLIVVGADASDNNGITANGKIISQHLIFSKSDAALPGSMSQDPLSNTIAVDDTTEDIRKYINIGDKVFDKDTNQERTVIEFIDDKNFKVNLPFEPSLQPTIVGSDTIPVRLYTSKKYMEMTTTDSDVAKILSQLDIGKYASLSLEKISGTTATTITNTKITFSDKLILDVDYTPSESVKAKVVIQHLNLETNTLLITADSYAKSIGGTWTGSDSVRVTIVQKDRFIDEIAPLGSSASSKYISKKLNLDASCNALKISFDALRDESCNVVLYYRTEQPNDQTPIFEKNWIKAEYNIEQNGILINKTPEATPDSFAAYESTLNGLPSFTGVQVKIVMLGGNPARSVKIKNLKVIALDE